MNTAPRNFAAVNNKQQNMENDYRILVVDDEEDLCEILKFNLETEGYTVETAYSAEEALTRDIASFNLLLLDERGRVFSRQELIDRIWPKDVLVLDRTVDVNITRLRKKIGRFAKCIVTRLGFGYYFDA